MMLVGKQQRGVAGLLCLFSIYINVLKDSLMYLSNMYAVCYIFLFHTNVRPL